MCFLQKYQHPPCLTQAICLDSVCSLENASNEYVASLCYNISIACQEKQLCVPYQMWMASVSKHERLRWNRRLFGTFGLGSCQMAGLPPLAFPGEEETWGQRKTDGWRSESIWLNSTHSEICARAYEFFWLLLHRKLCLTHMGEHCEMMQKNRFALGLCRCLACKYPTLGKHTLCHALAMEHNPKGIFQHIFRWQHIFRVICVALCNWCSRCNCQMPTLQKRYCFLFCKYYSACQNS